MKPEICLSECWAKAKRIHSSLLYSRPFCFAHMVSLLFIYHSVRMLSRAKGSRRERREGRRAKTSISFIGKAFSFHREKVEDKFTSQPSENGLQTSRPVHPCGALLSPTSLLALFTPGISSVPQFIFFLHLKMWWTPLTDGDAVKCAKHPRMKSVHGQKLHLYVFNSHDTKQQLVSPWWSLYHTSALSETSYLQDLIGI